MSFLHGRRRDHSSLPGRQRDQRRTATAAVGVAAARALVPCMHALYTHTIGTRRITTGSWEEKLHQPDFIS